MERKVCLVFCDYNYNNMIKKVIIIRSIHNQAIIFIVITSIINYNYN